MTVDFTSPEARQTMADNRFRLAALRAEAAGLVLNPQLGKETSRKYYGRALWYPQFSDLDLVRIEPDWHPEHEDAPSEAELVEFRNMLPYPACTMVSLTWLRNRYVGMRKGAWFKNPRRLCSADNDRSPNE